MKIFLIALACLYVAFNCVTAKLIGAEEMKQRFIDGQCVVGKIAANIFYSPAWLLKGVKFLAIKFIK